MIEGKQFEAVFMGPSNAVPFRDRMSLVAGVVFGGNNIIFGDEVNSDAREDAILGKAFLMSVY
jgi:hypothetical protein